MIVVVALGGGALWHSGQHLDLDARWARAREAADAVAEVAERASVVVTHDGSGPLPDATLDPVAAADVVNGCVAGCLLEREIADRLPDVPVATVLTRTVVSGSEPQLAELEAVRTLVQAGVLVLCCGGAGEPVVRAGDPTTRVDADLGAAVLARELGAEVLLLLTDVAAVEVDHGTPRARPVPVATPAQLRALHLPPAGIGAKVEAACRFVEDTGGTAVVGRLAEAGRLLEQRAGTVVAAPVVPLPRGERVATRCGVPLYPALVPTDGVRP